MKITSFSLSKLVEDVLGLFQHQASQKQLRLSYDIEKGVLNTISSDYRRLSQVLINLVGNALKFTFKGEIKLTIKKDSTLSTNLTFSIKDTGIGIKEEDRNKLFNFFGQAESQAVTSHGIGLGLCLSSYLIKLLGNHQESSKLFFESQVDIGTTFYFSIPVYEPISEENKTFTMLDEVRLELGYYEPPVMPVIRPQILEQLGVTRRGSLCVSRKSSENVAPKKKNILVVDDNSFNFMVFEKHVPKNEYAIIHAYNGKEAIEKVKEMNNRKEKLGLIIMDLQMPVMDGFEATKELKRMINEGNIQEVPILACTANNGEDERNKWLEIAMGEFFAKPLSRDNILEMIKKCVV